MNMAKERKKAEAAENLEEKIQTETEGAAAAQEQPQDADQQAEQCAALEQAAKSHADAAASMIVERIWDSEWQS